MTAACGVFKAAVTGYGMRPRARSRLGGAATSGELLRRHAATNNNFGVATKGERSESRRSDAKRWRRGGRHVTAHHIKHDGSVTTAHRRRHRPTSKTQCRLTVSTDVAVSVTGSGRCDIGVPALGSWWFASGCLTPGTTWALSGLVFCNISKQLSLLCVLICFSCTHVRQICYVQNYH